MSNTDINTYPFQSEIVRGSSEVLDNAPYYKMFLGQTGGPFSPNTFLEVNTTTGAVQPAGVGSKTCIGATRLEHLPGAIMSGGAFTQVGYGRCCLVGDQVINPGQRLKVGQLSRAVPFIDDSLAGTTIATGAGVTFTNQPTGDQFEVLSSSASDVTQTVTVYYTKTGTTTTILSQTITLTGTTAVASTDTTVQQVFAVTKSAATVGTVTVRKKTGAATITTLAPATLTSGLLTISAGSAYNGIPTLVVDAADTANVAILGTGTGDAALSSVIAATGTTKANFGAVPFKTVTFAMVGAATTARTYTVAVAGRDSNDALVGRALSPCSGQGIYFDAFVLPVS
jgi:hypothetical protein